MVKILFLVEEWSFKPKNLSGSASLAKCHLQLLTQSGHKITAGIIINETKEKSNNPEISLNKAEGILGDFTGSIPINLIHITPKGSTEVNRVQSILFEPDVFRFGNRVSPQNQMVVRQVFDKVNPDLVWAEDLYPATLAQRSTTSKKVVYSHYDWKWRIKWHRVGKAGRTLKKRFDLWMSKRHEYSLVRQVSGVVSASASETGQIRKLGVKNVGYFPTAYEPVTLPPLEQTLLTPRIVHLGGMQATANRIGLERFLRVAWPKLKVQIKPKPELWVIGSLDGAPKTLQELLIQPGIVCTGYVDDLSSVLRPFDMHIIPWELNTGTRTRIPLILNYAQVLISTRAGAACIDELKHEVNCILVNDLKHMASEIKSLCNDDKKREAIGREGRNTFFNYFTLESQQPRFNHFIEDVLSHS